MPRNIPKSKAIAGLLPAMKWFKDNIFDAVEKGKTGEYAKGLAVAEHKAREGGMCFTNEPDDFDGETAMFIRVFKASDCDYGSPKPGARSVGQATVSAPDTDDAAIRYGEAAAAYDYFGDRPLRVRRSR